MKTFALYLIISCFSGPYIYPATISRVIDGDTVVVEIKILPELISTNQRIRILGFNAEEIRGANRYRGLRQKRKAQNILPVGEEVTVRLTKHDSFGRWLGNICINDELFKDLMQK